MRLALAGSGGADPQMLSLLSHSTWSMAAGCSWTVPLVSRTRMTGGSRPNTMRPMRKCSGRAGRRAPGPRAQGLIEASPALGGGLEPPDGKPRGCVLRVEVVGGVARGEAPSRREASSLQPGEDMTSNGGAVGRAGRLAEREPHTGRRPALTVVPPGGECGAQSALAELSEAWIPWRVIKDRARVGGGRTAGQVGISGSGRLKGLRGDVGRRPAWRSEMFFTVQIAELSCQASARSSPQVLVEGTAASERGGWVPWHLGGVSS